MGFPTMELLIRGKQRAHYAFYGFGEAIPKEVPNLGAETRVLYLHLMHCCVPMQVMSVWLPIP